MKQKLFFQILIIVFNVSVGYSQNNNCEPCQDALHYKQQYDESIINVYNNWHTVRKERGGYVICLITPYSPRVNYLHPVPGRMNPNAELNAVRPMGPLYLYNPDETHRDSVSGGIITQLNPVGYRFDKRSPDQIIAAGGYFPYIEGNYGYANDICTHVRESHSGSFVSTTGNFSLTVNTYADIYDDQETRAPGEIIGWVVEFRYNCQGFSTFGEGREILTSYIPIDHIICWVPIRKYKNDLPAHCGISSFGYKKDFCIMYNETVWNSFYKGDKYFNPQHTPDANLFNEPQFLKQQQGQSPLPANPFMHRLKSDDMDIDVFGIFSKVLNIDLSMYDYAMHNIDLLGGRYNEIIRPRQIGIFSNGAGRITFTKRLVIEPNGLGVICTGEIIFEQGYEVKPGGRLIIYHPDGEIKINEMVVSGTNNWIDIRN